MSTLTVFRETPRFNDHELGTRILACNISLHVFLVS